MSAISIILELGLLLAGAYLWMRYFFSPRRHASDSGAADNGVPESRRHAGSKWMLALGCAGIIMMIVGLSGISRSMLSVMDVGAAAPGDLPGTGSSPFIRVLLGSLFSGIAAGAVCLLMRFLLARRERSRGRTARTP